MAAAAAAVATARPGPGSLTWRYASDGRAALLAPTALLLQVAHPVVGAGVSQHSTFTKAPWRRLIRTIQSTNCLIFASAEKAAAEAARLRHVHGPIRGVDEAGRSYRALDVDAYAWVHLTLAYAFVTAQRLFAQPPDPDQLDRFYQEWRAVGEILRLPPDRVPSDWPEFDAYFGRMVSGTLEPTRAVADLLAALTHPQPPVPAVPAVLWRPAAQGAGRISYRFAIGTIPQVLRDRLRLDWTPADERRFEREVGWLRTAFSLTPQPLLTAPFSLPFLVRARCLPVR
jgi:uncharacterized protein (DUF2236 family)